MLFFHASNPLCYHMLEGICSYANEMPKSMMYIVMKRANGANNNNHKVKKKQQKSPNSCWAQILYICIRTRSQCIYIYASSFIIHFRCIHFHIFHFVCIKTTISFQNTKTRQQNIFLFFSCMCVCARTNERDMNNLYTCV